MGTFNAVFTAVFDVLLAPLGHRLAALDLVAWPTIAGVVALIVYKYASYQQGIARAKTGIQVNLLEVLLYNDQLGVVMRATLGALAQNALYLGYNLGPMLVMFVPMTAILVQIVANYAYAPLPVGSIALFVAELEPRTVSPKDVTLELPPGVSLDAPPVRTPATLTDPNEVAWRLRLDAEGDHVVRVHAGDATESFTLSVGGPPRKVTVLRTKSWEALLYPAESVPAADSPVYALRVDRRDRELPFFPDGEGGILLWFFGSSLLAGLLLKDRFGVTL